ncbi:MAG: hypothetical protein AAFX76_13800, partial [Planctomycetota bacterium]
MAHRAERRPWLERLWNYYRNPVERGSHPGGDAGHTAQTRGLPLRLTQPGGEHLREVVVENDIAWRVHALVDFMFGQPLLIQSRAEGAGRAEVITGFLADVFRANGGEGFFHDLALLGSVYGYVDVLVRFPSGDEPPRLDLIEATRAVPLLHPDDYRQLDAYLIDVPVHRAEQGQV